MSTTIDLLIREGRPECVAAYFEPWAIEPSRLARALAQIEAGTLKPQAVEPKAASRDEKAFATDGAGTAVIDLEGELMKQRSKFGGTSTIDARRQIRLAAADPDVSSILLAISSPGGTVAGTLDLADDIAAAARQKPLHAHISDIGASAAYWAASQAARVSANATAQVGSIGTFAVLVDQSKRFEDAGIKVHVIATGKSKGKGYPGTEIDEETIGEVRELVDDLNTFFLKGVAKGRALEFDKVKDLATGEVWIAAKAKRKGLIDAVESFDDALLSVRKAGMDYSEKRRRRRTSAQQIHYETQRLRVFDA